LDIRFQNAVDDVARAKRDDPEDEKGGRQASDEQTSKKPDAAVEDYERDARSLGGERDSPGPTERLREPREHHKVRVNSDASEGAGTERRERVVATRSNRRTRKGERP
jgi:hypothetical protein